MERKYIFSILLSTLFSDEFVWLFYNAISASGKVRFTPLMLCYVMRIIRICSVSR